MGLNLKEEHFPVEYRRSILPPDILRQRLYCESIVRVEACRQAFLNVNPSDLRIDHSLYQDINELFYLREEFVEIKGGFSIPYDSKTEEALCFERNNKEKKLALIMRTDGILGDLFDVLPRPIYYGIKDVYWEDINSDTTFPLIRVNKKRHHFERAFYIFYLDNNADSSASNSSIIS